MNKRNLIYVLALALCVIFSSGLAYSYSGAKAICLTANPAPKIDGVVSPGEWGNEGIYLSKAVCLKGQAKYNGFGNVYQPDFTTDENDISGTIYSMWDKNNLYLAAKVTDDDIFLEKSAGWDNDCCEIRFSVDGTKVTGFWITPKLTNKNPGWYWNNAINGATATEESTLIKSTIGAKGYEFEVAIPLTHKSVEGLNPAVGKVVGHTVSIGDQDKKGAEYSMPVWSLNPAKWEWAVPFWGEITFSANVPASVSPNAKLTANWGDIKVK